MPEDLELPPPPIEKLPYTIKPVDLKAIMPAPLPHPPLPKFLFELPQPVKVEISVKGLDYLETTTPPTALLQIKIYEKTLKKGVPLALYTVYLDDEEIYSGTTDVEGEDEYLVGFKELGTHVVKVALVREELKISDELSITVFKGHLYDGGSCWWMIGMPSMVWFDERKPSPRVGDMLWFTAAVFTGPRVAYAWENKTDVLCHVDMILISPSGKVYNLNVTDNDVTLAPNGGRFMHSCACLLQPIERLNERGTWKLAVNFQGTSKGWGPTLLDRKEVDFRVS